jgi:hypothetical protein
MTESDSRLGKWVTAAISTALLLLLLRQRRQKRRAAQRNAANAAKTALLKALRDSTLPVFVQPESLPAGWGVAPPVFYPPYTAVIPLVLPREIEEIERSSHLVCKVSVAASGGEAGDDGQYAFILCSYTGAVAGAAGATVGRDAKDESATASSSAEAQKRRQQQQLLADLLVHHPVLKGQFAEAASRWTALDTVFPMHERKKRDTAATTTPHAVVAGGPAHAVVPVFTHVLVGPDNCVLLGGVNGPYLIVGVFNGFEGTLKEEAVAGTAAGDSKRAAESPLLPPKPGHVEANKTAASAAAGSAVAVMDLERVIRGVARATFKVPLPTVGQEGSSFLSDARLPGGAPFAVHRGHYRVLCVRDGRELELCVPSEITVRSELVNQSLITPPLRSPVAGRVPRKTSVDAAAAAAPDALLTLVYVPSPFTEEESTEVRVTEEVFAALLAKPEEAAMTLLATSSATPRANPGACIALRDVTARPLDASHGRSNMVTVVYVQPQLGVLFSVHPLSSVVYEPWMTDLPTILYYPLGEEDVEDGVGGAGRAAPPLMSIEYVVQLPDTWEVLKKDEEELRHNVLFHFTSWEAATVTSSMTEISGLRCVMLHEVRDGRRCRSYVLPRGSTVLIVRWETAVETWEEYLPVFQQTLDTLHIDAAAITK